MMCDIRTGCVGAQRSASSGLLTAGRRTNPDCGIAAIDRKGGLELGGHAQPAASIVVEK